MKGYGRCGAKSDLTRWQNKENALPSGRGGGVRGGSGGGCSLVQGLSAPRHVHATDARQGLSVEFRVGGVQAFRGRVSGCFLVSGCFWVSWFRGVGVRA